MTLQKRKSLAQFVRWIAFWPDKADDFCSSSGQKGFSRTSISFLLTERKLKIRFWKSKFSNRINFSKS